MKKKEIIHHFEWKLVRVSLDVNQKLSIIADKEMRSIPKQVENFLKIQITLYKENKGIKAIKTITKSKDSANYKLVRIPPYIMKDIIMIADKEFRSIPMQIEMFLKHQIAAYEIKRN